MRTERQRETARINGTKSRGPKTPEGKRISSLNALRREMTAGNLLIKGERESDFAALIRQLYAEFRPLRGTEQALVESMAVARWRVYRIQAIESAALEHEARNHKAMTGDKFDDVTHLAYGVRNLTDHSRLLDFIARELSRCDLQYARAHRALLSAQARRAKNYPRVPSGIPEETIQELLEKERSVNQSKSQVLPETNPGEPETNPSDPED